MTCQQCLTSASESADSADVAFRQLLAMMNAAGNPGMTANTLAQRRERKGLRQKEVWVDYPIPGWPVGPQEFTDNAMHARSTHDAVLLADDSVGIVDGNSSFLHFSGRPGQLLAALEEIAKTHQVS